MWGVEGMFGGEVGDFQAGVLPFDLFRAAKREGGLRLSWQTHLAGNCSDQTDNHSWKCLDKQKFTAPIGKVNRSRISPVHQQ